MKWIEYKDIKKNRYEIDEFGNIYSHYSKRFMSPTKDRDGYLHLHLSREEKNKRIDVRVATLVAWTYLGPPSNNIKDLTVNHIDGNRLNNHYTNLEWMERAKNTSIRKNKSIGENNARVKLTEKQVEEICNLLENTEMSLKKIGEKYNVSKSTISNIARKVNWKHIVNKYNFSCRKQVRNKNGTFRIINTKLNHGENNV